MTTINERLLSFAVTAYGILKTESETSCYYQLRDGKGYDYTASHYMEYLMLKKSWYHGNYCVFEGGTYACNFDVNYLESLLQEREKEKAIRASKPEVKGE